MNQIELKDNSAFEEMKAVAEANNTDIIDLLIANCNNKLDTPW